MPSAGRLAEPPFKVRTISGATLELVHELGRGGQGSVYEVAGGRHAVKLLHETTPEQAREWADRLRTVSRLPLDGLPLARPIDTLLPPETGYVMDLMDGMVPVSRLISVPPAARAVDHYRDTGGLRRRLSVLARTADVLARLHAAGLVYQDPSPTNVFVPGHADSDEVWLIDTDNLAYAGTRQRPVCTARYRAPELRPAVRRNADSLSDAFAFSVIAFELLTLDHPFIGDALYSADEEAEAQAFDGAHPWVDDPADPSNRSSRGIQPRSLVLSPAIEDMFREAFAAGLHTRDRRPGAARWAEVMRAAASSTVRCAGCGMTYYLPTAAGWCPWCEEVPQPSVLHIRALVDVEAEPSATGEDGESPGAVTERGHLVAVEGEELQLTRGAVLGLVADPDQLLCQLHWAADRLKIRNLADQAVELVAPDASRTRPLQPGAVASLRAEPGEAMWRVRFGRPNRPNRWLSFEIEQGGRP